MSSSSGNNTKESLDLMNVDYEDVLRLYKGWRKTESALKDKDQELVQLKTRMTKLQESHQKFRHQIQALESVKELTITLQSQLTSLQQEKKQLIQENKELVQFNLKAEELLKEKDQDEMKQLKMYNNLQLEHAELKGRCEELARTNKDVERLAMNEQAGRQAIEGRLNTSNQSIENLLEENKALKKKIETMTLKLNQCDQELLHASEQLTTLSREIANINHTKDVLQQTQAENGMLKGDISRLLRLLEQSPQCREFLAHWHDSQGMTFVGIDKYNSNQNFGGTSVFENTISNNNNNNNNNTNASEGFFDEALSKYDITPQEFAHLKRVHGSDPFPMTNNLTEESEFWVPNEAARLGVKFMHQRFPHASPKVIMDFLRSMNKIWLRRERRKVKRVKEILGADIEDLKRQLSNSKPYKGVIAERQIRRLKSQVKTERGKQLHGRPRRKLETVSMHPNDFELEDFDPMTISSTSHHSAHDSRRLCRIHQQQQQLLHGTNTSSVGMNNTMMGNTIDGGVSHMNNSINVARISTEKLLEASLQSLETISKRQSMSNTLPSNISTMYGHSMNASMLGHPSHGQGSHGGHSHLDTSGLDIDDTHDGTAMVNYPSASYLRGALWIGRNMTIISEELAEKLESYRVQCLTEISDIARDVDSRRRCHRLTVHANNIISHVCGLTAQAQSHIRKMLQGLAGIEAGNASQYKRFLLTLPIESTLAHEQFLQDTTANGNGNGNGVGTDYEDNHYDSDSHSHSHSHSRYYQSPMQRPSSAPSMHSTTNSGISGGGGGQSMLLAQYDSNGVKRSPSKSARFAALLDSPIFNR